MNPSHRRVALVLLLGLLGLQVLVAIGVYLAFPDDWAKRGQFGDLFGVVNALFSGLAIAGVVYTVLVQQEQLSAQLEQLTLTREDLALTREEMRLARQEVKRTADAQEKSQTALAEQARAGQLRAFRDLYDDLTSESSRADRRTLYNEILRDPTRTSLEHWRIVERVANSFDVLGFYVVHGFVPKDLVLDRFASIVVRTWRYLEPFVEYNRKSRRRSIRSWRYFESAFVEAQSYLKHNFPDHEVVTISDAGDKIIE
jgi:hypothetical protein